MLRTVVVVAADVVGDVDEVERRRLVVPEPDLVGPGAEAAEVAGGARRQQLVHCLRRRVAQPAFQGSSMVRRGAFIWSRKSELWAAALLPHIAHQVLLR